MRWRGFCEELIEGAHALEIDLVATLGALLADTPHTRPVPVSGTASDAATAAQMNVESSRYEGPTGIVGVFGEACQSAGLPAVSFWAAVPHYVAQPPCPKATLALLRRVEDLLDIEVPLGDLVERSRSLGAPGRRAGGGRLRRRRIRALAGAARAGDRAARGQRRRDRPRVRALPAPPRFPLTAASRGPARKLERDPEQRVDGGADQRRRLGVCRVAGERPVSPGVDGGQRHRRIEVVRQAGPHAGEHADAVRPGRTRARSLRASG